MHGIASHWHNAPPILRSAAHHCGVRVCGDNSVRVAAVPTDSTALLQVLVHGVRDLLLRA